MAGKEAYAPWLLSSKQFVGETKEWKDFTVALHDTVDHHLTEHHVSNFSDLDSEERFMFMDKAARAIQDGRPYQNVYSQVSLTLDQQINNSVAKEMMTASTVLSSTKSELVLDHMRDGAVNILKRWPEMKKKLHMCLNMPIPHKLQSVAWSFFTSDSRVRSGYLDHLMHKPKAAISRKDHVITETCENILKIQNTFPDIGPPSVGSFYAMKAVLSYFHAQLRTDSDLHHVYYLLILPMLQVLSNYLSKTQPAANNVVAALVEMYMTFMRYLPKYVADFRNRFENERKEFTTKVAENLIEFEKNAGFTLSRHIASLSMSQPADPNETKVATDVTLAVLSSSLFGVVSSLIKSLFVGFLNKDLLMFVWDQYVIGLDVAGYHWHFLPAFTAILFLLLHDDIKNCTSLEDLEATVQRECHKIHISHVQQKIKLWCFKTLYTELNQDDKAAISVIDPTKVAEKTWAHWNHELIPNRLGPPQRKTAREARQAERDRLVALRREEEARNREEIALRERLAEQQLRQIAEQKRSKCEEERRKLEELLEKEKIQRLHKDKLYEDELYRLRLEIEEMKRLQATKNSAPSAGTIRSYPNVLAPPPSRASKISLIPATSVAHLPSVQEYKRRTPPAIPDAEDILHDLVSIVANKFKQVAHGAGSETVKLNQGTTEDLTEHRIDVKHAEMEVFGRHLKPGEFDSLPAGEQKVKGEEMMNVVRRRVEDRRGEELKQK